MYFPLRSIADVQALRTHAWKAKSAVIIARLHRPGSGGSRTKLGMKDHGLEGCGVLAGQGAEVSAFFERVHRDGRRGPAHVCRSALSRHPMVSMCCWRRQPHRRDFILAGIANCECELAQEAALSGQRHVVDDIRAPRPGHLPRRLAPSQEFYGAPALNRCRTRWSRPRVASACGQPLSYNG